MKQADRFIATFTRFFCSSHKNLNLIFKNPCLDLEQYLEIPLLTENEKLFLPKISTMQAAQELFTPKSNHRIQLITSTIHPEKFPQPEKPEVVLIGQSNVGKSSLLAAIFQNCPELRIKVSKKPGLTKSAQFFQVGENLCLVDMPGYGEAQPEWFTELVENYLRYRRNLIKTFLLINGEDGFQQWDEIALQMLEEFKVPYAVILTKIDKASDAKRLKNLLHLMKIKNSYSSLLCFPQPFMTSSSTLEGLGLLLAFIGHITGNLTVEA